MERILEELAQSDHSDADCVFVAVLSHGELGILYACDQPFKPDRLWSHFNAEKCPSLAGKPKLFFVQVRNSSNYYSLIYNLNIYHNFNNYLLHTLPQNIYPTRISKMLHKHA